MKINKFLYFQSIDLNRRVSVCFNDFSDLLELANIIRNEIVIFGDFHIHLDANEDPNSRKFTELLTTFNLVQHVPEVTHESRHLLDFVITSLTDLISNLNVGDYFLDHREITFGTNVEQIRPPRVMYTSRNYKNIDIEAFAQDVSSHFPNITCAATLEEFENLHTKYDSIISE